MAARSRPHRFALVAVVLLAAANFCWQLGSSSYFVDEVLSIRASTHRLDNVLRAVTHTEITPPAYFYFQHAWLGTTGSQAEWVARLPSALGGVLLVVVVYWLGRRLAERDDVALVAAALAALSPFVLEFAQRAQGYLLASLAVAASAAAALTAERARDRRGRWLLLSAVGAGLGLTINYTATLAIAPLCVWVARQRSFTLRWRQAYVGVCAVVQLALLPLFIAQWRAEPGRHGVGAHADVTWTTLGQLARTPLQGRVDALPWLAVVVVLAGLVGFVAVRSRLPGAWRLFLVIGVGEPVVLLVLSAFGARVALTRYAAVAVPFLCVMLAAAVVLLPRPLAVLGGLAMAVAVAAGLVANHRASSFYPDTRGAIDYVQARQRPGDVLLSPTESSVAVPLAYYGARRLRPVLPYASAGSPRAALFAGQHHRLWVVSQVASNSVSARALIAIERPLAARFGYRPLEAQVFPSGTPLAVVLWAPFRPPGPG